MIHKNIVRLIGRCLEVDILHGSSGVTMLTLEQRINVAADSAEGQSSIYAFNNDKYNLTW